MKKKICIVTPRLPPLPGGIGVQAHELGKYLKRKNYEVHFLTYGRGAVYENNSVSEQTINTTTIPLSSNFLAVTAKLLPFVKRFDIMHCFGYTSLTKSACMCAKLLRKPLVLTYVGGEVWDYRKKFPDIFSLVTKNADCVVCDSLCLSKKLYNDLHIKSKTIHPAVSDLFLSAPENKKISENPDALKDASPIFLCVKGLVKRSGCDILIRAFAEVVSIYNRAVLLLCGEGPEEQNLKALVSGLSIAKNVVFTGAVSDETLHYYYSISDAFILPSLIEAFPAVILEALASGKPVLATDTEGPSEAKQYFPEDIHLVEKGNATAMAEQIKRIFSLPSVSESTLKKIKNEFCYSVFCENYLRLYETIFHTSTRHCTQDTATC